MCGFPIHLGVGGAYVVLMVSQSSEGSLGEVKGAMGGVSMRPFSISECKLILVERMLYAVFYRR